ncbi:acetyl-CoA carboxylase biotin carboxyl carrier protein [Rhizomicrobium electricum]|nr:acetyl-CoA carboxylase biotin carboxyl carrier protein [Rhizomicrobium electricum]NIJ47666.1 acetyl-CoA carboxylase biotin carboxyl carrier protein [Rhizomicrobium electricum]
MPSIDSSVIRELAELLTETGLTEIEVEQGGARLRVVRQVINSYVSEGPMRAAATPGAASTGETPAPAKPKGPPAGAVPSPMVGTVYVAPEPGKPPFVKVGDKVSEGDTLLIVEAMKTMNPIVSPRAGTVTEICVNDAEPVEFGQTLLVIA